ncbi:MAG: hypothetical protein HOQ09_07455 [Gemmatimonadaceae bacterium]|nr:hypothetical protein [Gemmatimonadaceae bacterium]
MSLRRLLALAVLPLAAAIACHVAYAPKALYPISADTLRLSALTGTPIDARSAVLLLSGSEIVPGQSENFDFALDIDANGNVVIIPRTKVLTCTSLCQLGIAFPSAPFDSLYDAPERGYVYDSTKTVAPGKAVAFVTKATSCIPSNISTYDVYAKMVVDSVRMSDRAIFIRLVTDPNCGFRGLVPGIVPKH